ncbi:hypothetical protein I3400192H8_16140 [Dialister sp. i34-0019-2H8]
MEGGHPVSSCSLRFESRAEGSDGKTMRHKDGETSDNGVSHFFTHVNMVPPMKKIPRHRSE